MAEFSSSLLNALSRVLELSAFVAHELFAFVTLLGAVSFQSTCPVRLLGSSPCGDGNCAHIRRVCERLPLALAVSRAILIKLLRLLSSVSLVALVAASYCPPKAI